MVLPFLSGAEVSTFYQALTALSKPVSIFEGLMPWIVGGIDHMANREAHTTAPEDRIPFVQKILYGFGAFVNNTLAAGVSTLMNVLIVVLAMDPRTVGWLGAIPRLVDALTDPLMGYTSDKTKSRFGRRRPYIFFGAIAAGVIFFVLWQLPLGKSTGYYYWYFLIVSLIFFVAYTVFATPWVALGYELTPDYHERTRLMGVQNFFGSIAYLISPYYLSFVYNQEWFDNGVDGAATLALIIGIVTIVLGIMPAIFLRERSAGGEDAGEKTSLSDVVVGFFKGFYIAIKFKPFFKICIATFLVFNGFILISALQYFVVVYYVFGGDNDVGSDWFGHAGLIQGIFGLVVVAFVAWLGTKIGKRKAFYTAISISIVGYALKWFCYTPGVPMSVLIPAPFMAFGLAGLFTIVPSMVADVVDADELNTGERREGMFGSIFWWVVKLGQSLAMLAGGYLLAATGFDIELGAAQTTEALTLMRLADAFVPCIASIIAIWAIASFSITEKRAHEIRAELEARRGTMEVEATPA